MDTNSDRTALARLDDGGQIARYDRSGKYYLEYPSETKKKRRALKIGEAVELAVAADGKPGARIELGHAGGMAFDSRVRQARQRRKAGVQKWAQR